MPSYTYLLHAERAYVAQTGKCQKKARHYIGATTDLDTRLDDHRNGKGARLTAVWKEAGISFRVVYVWEFPDEKGGFDFERRLKRRKRAAAFCPCCGGTLPNP